MHKILVACLLTIGLSACAVGNQHDYQSTVPELKVQTTASVDVAAQDKRIYVVNGEKKPDFVGLSRGGLGNPFNITTVSGRPLADDFRDTVVKALKAKGINADAVTLSATEDARQLLMSRGKDRGLVFAINEWKSDTYMNTALHYDVELSVLDQTGKLLANHKISGNDDLGGSGNPPGHAKGAVPYTFKQKLDQLLNDPKVIAALAK